MPALGSIRLPAASGLGRARPRSLATQKIAAELELEDLGRAFKLFPRQRAFVYTPYKFSFFVGGVGSGKSHAGACRAIYTALKIPGSIGVVGAPTYPMLRDTSQKALFDLLPRSLISSYNHNSGKLILINGSEIWFRTMVNPDRVARGLNVTWAWLDEAPLCGYYAWQLIKARIGRQGGAYNAQALAFCTGTPKGRDGFWREFEETPEVDHALYRASTFENKAISADEYVRGLGYSGQFYLQEVLGRFEAFAGLVYRFEPSLHAPGTHVRIPPKGTVFKQVIAGMDWGFANPACAVVFGIDEDTRAWQLAEYYKQGVFEEHGIIPAAVAMCRQYHVDTWFCDPARPDLIEKTRLAMSKAGLKTVVREADNDILSGIQTVMSFLLPRDDPSGRGLSRGLYVHPACVNTIKEYGSYQYPTKDDAKRNINEKPVGLLDHSMDASRYALHGAFGDLRTQRVLSHLERRSSYRKQRIEAALADPDNWY